MKRRAPIPSPLSDPPADDLRLLTTQEVVALLSLSRPTLWRMVGRGELPPPIHLTTTRIAWRASDLRAWLNQREAVAR